VFFTAEAMFFIAEAMIFIAQCSSLPKQWSVLPNVLHYRSNDFYCPVFFTFDCRTTTAS
jgi:hypothetical protein